MENILLSWDVTQLGLIPEDDLSLPRGKLLHRII
jgi:hypothetical protein